MSLEDHRNHLPIIAEYLSGAVSGMAGTVSGHPLDTIKVQLQIGALNHTYAKVFDAIHAVHKKGWVRGYFRGLALPLLSQGIINSIMFGTYGWTLRIFRANEGTTTYSRFFIAGCISSIFCLPICVPIDVVKLVLQGQIDQAHTLQSTSRHVFYKGPVDCIQGIVRTNGLKGLYRGFCIHSIRDVFANGWYFLCYEYTFDKLFAMGWTTHGGALASITAGGLAGAISWLCILPLDVVKSQIQAEANSATKRPAVELFRQTFARGGLAAFFAGCTPLLVRAFFVNSIIFFTHHQTLRVLAKFNKDNKQCSIAETL